MRQNEQIQAKCDKDSEHIPPVFQKFNNALRPQPSIRDCRDSGIAILVFAEGGLYEKNHAERAHDDDDQTRPDCR